MTSSSTAKAKGKELASGSPPQAWLISSKLLLSCIPLPLRTQTWAMTCGGQWQSSEGRGGVEGEVEEAVLGPGADEE